MYQTTCFFGRSTACFIRVFECSHFDVFFTPKKEDPNQEKGSKFGSRIEISNPKTSQRGSLRPKKGWPKGCPFRVLGDARSPNASRQPCTVAKLIEKFESHQQKEQFLKDMSQTQKINRFSEASQKLLQDVDQTEIFEFCENSTKLQCSDCNSFTEIRIIYCSCGRNLKKSRSPQHFKRTSTIAIRTLATSLRRISVEDQCMANLRKKLCSSKRKTC